MSELPLISVIVPTFNRRPLLDGLLAALEGQSYPRNRYEIILVDDGSTDDTAAFLTQFAAHHPYFRFITQVHSGPYVARNLAMARAGGEIFAFTDDDCLASQDWLSVLARVFTSRPDALGVQGSTRSIPELMTPFTHQIVRPRGSRLYETCNIAYRADAVRAHNGFDGTIFFGFGDTILAAQILRRGPIIFAPDAVVTHRPIPRVFYRRDQWRIILKGEWKLAHSCRGYYWRQRGPGFLGGVFLQWMIGNTLKELAMSAVWLRREPMLYFSFTRRLLAERLRLLAVLPGFWWDCRRPSRRRA